MSVTSTKPLPIVLPDDQDIYFGYDVEDKANAFADLLEHRRVAKVAAMHGQSQVNSTYVATVLNDNDGWGYPHGYVIIWWNNPDCANSKGYCGRWDAHDSSKRRWQYGDLLQLSRAIPWSRLSNLNGAWITEGTTNVGWVGEGKSPGAFLTIQSLPQSDWTIRFQMKMRDAAIGTAAGFGFKDADGQTQYFLLDANAARQNCGMIALGLFCFALSNPLMPC